MTPDNRKKIPNLSPVLHDKLSQNEELWSLLHPMLKKGPRPGDMAKIDTLKSLGAKILKDDKVFTGEFENLTNHLVNGATLGLPTRLSTMSAILLAGAAIAHNDIPALRPDLDASIVNARGLFQNRLEQLRGPIGEQKVFTRPAFTLPHPKFGNVFIGRFAEFPEDPFVQKVTDVYGTLINLNQNGILATQIKSILTDPSKTLRFGIDMNALSLPNIHQYFNQFFGSDVSRQTDGGPQPGNDWHDGTSSAPKQLQLAIPKFHCVHTSVENGSEDIFWFGAFAHCTNLDTLYAMIDEAINNNSSLDFSLGNEIQMEVIPKQSPTVRCSSGVGIDLDCFNFGPNDMVNGLFPWSCMLECIRNNKQEDQALAENLQNISATAGAISEGAAITAAATGPTVASAGAAVVSVISGGISLVCEIGAAIVDIMSMFDHNDYLGEIDLPLQDSQNYGGDYLGVQENPNPPLSSEITVGNSDYPLSDYTIQDQECLIGQQNDIHRRWRVFTDTAWGDQVEDSGYLWGNSWDADMTVKFTQKMDYIVSQGCTLSSSDGDAHWIDKPQWSDDSKTSCHGKVHWGINAFETVTFKPWVEAIKFLKPM